MLFSELFAKKSPTFSFEFFPPRKLGSAIELGVNVGQLLDLNPSFVSVTYGAGGTTQDITFDLADYLQNKLGLLTVAHYTCVNATADKVLADIELLYSKNIHNLMLLRGDRPKGVSITDPWPGEFPYASDIVSFVAKQNRFGIGVAGYPEVHPEAPNAQIDLQHLKNKVDLGADVIITQMFFDNQHYFDFVEKAKQLGINKPIIPGIMPIVDIKQIKRLIELSGTKIPAEIEERFERIKHSPELMYQLGVDIAIWQCIDLLKGGAPGLHFYTLNKSQATIDIFSSIPKRVPLI